MCGKLNFPVTSLPKIILRKKNFQHKFHRTCIQTWLSKNNTCPTCRESVFEDLDPVWNSDDSSDDSIDVDVAGIPLFHMHMNALGHGHMFDVSASDDSIASVDSDVSDASNESDLFSLHVPSIDSWGYQTSPSLADTLEMDAESGDSLNGMSDSSSVEETDAMNESQISVRSESEHSEQSDDGSENVVTISSDESSDSDVMLYDSSDNSD